MMPKPNAANSNGDLVIAGRALAQRMCESEAARLRAAFAAGQGVSMDHAIVDAMADEIERLRAELAEQLVIKP